MIPYIYGYISYIYVSRLGKLLGSGVYSCRETGVSASWGRLEVPLETLEHNITMDERDASASTLRMVSLYTPPRGEGIAADLMLFKTGFFETAFNGSHNRSININRCYKHLCGLH